MTYKTAYPAKAVFYFVLGYAVTVIVAIPSLPFNLAAGYFWGGVLGGFYATVGVTIGGGASFLAARYFFGQPLANKFENKYAARVQQGFDKSGWKFIAFVRMNPIIPTGPFNFFLGLTNLKIVTFVWTTFVFLMPPTVAVAFIGDALQTFSNEGEAGTILKSILIISASVTILAVIRFSSKNFSKDVGEK
jgi:uncharacterized membrane protein YdjX (TVP38/TMEM64 family)